MDRSSSTWADDRLHGPDTDVPVTPRLAATVILARDGADGRLELFMVRRGQSARFAPDAYVFPGGTVRADDRAPGGEPPLTGLTAEAAHARLGARGGAQPDTPGDSLALHVAALRELFEEAGVLLAYAGERPDAPLDAESCTALAALRPRVQAGSSLIQIARERRLALTPEHLIYFSHWITPAVSPRRYDTRFFVAEDRAEQTASHCGVETVEGGWFAPADMLARADARTATLVSVTAEHLRVISRCQTAGALLQFARSKAIRTVVPIRDHGGWDIGGADLPW
ncbi:MAG: hypothetical protein IT306_01100 [Chloroflexi bacterium]|nr:hypothetical protein [Chloroflexota bacterium]